MIFLLRRKIDHSELYEAICTFAGPNEDYRSFAEITPSVKRRFIFLKKCNSLKAFPQLFV